MSRELIPNASWQCPGCGSYNLDTTDAFRGGNAFCRDCKYYPILLLNVETEMNILENYEKALQAIYDHVGFVEDWVVYSIDIRDDMFWEIVNDEEVRYAKTKELDGDGDTYSDEICTQRFYKKHVYRGEKYTLIFVDNHTDGNKFFAIYDNEKEIKESENEI